jgi:hypothetical protein
MTKLPLIATFSIALPALAGEPAGIRFTHHDWELACDNTRTCRAAGYQADDARGPAVSVLLERPAGPRQPVTATLQIGEYDEEASVPNADALTMSIDRRPLGAVKLDPKTLTGKLTAAQTDALVAALAKSTVLQWTDGKQVWTVSGAGAAAVLLKIDEIQGRIGTTGALLRKGTKGEDGVAPALPMPEVKAAAVDGKEVPLDAAVRTALLAELRRTIGEGDCEKLSAAGLSAMRLNASKLLVSAVCWTGAYNEGTGYWVTNERAPYAPAFVTASGSDFADSAITSAQKGRGLGDCWATQEWVWDGRRFALTEDATTGMCRLVAAGGPWKLPTYAAKVVRPKR